MGRIAIASLNDILALRRAPTVWRGGRTREVFIPEVGRLTMEGWVTVELIHARTGFIKQRLHFKNLVTDAALDSFGTNHPLGDWMNSGWIGVGTGNAAPANSDVGLQTPTGVRTNSVGGGTESAGWGAANAYAFKRAVREFSEAQSNGNLTEFGMFRASAGDIMLARQLFKDAGGAPTVVTKTSDDKLRITYEFRLYPPTVDTAGAALVQGVSYNYAGRATNIGVDSAWGFGGAVGAGTHFGRSGAGVFFCNANNGTGLGGNTSGGITGASQSAGADTSTFTAYVPGSFFQEYTCVWNVGSANFTSGVRGFNCQSFTTSASTVHQLLLSAFIPKVNTQKLTLIFRYGWGRH